MTSEVWKERKRGGDVDPDLGQEKIGGRKKKRESSLVCLVVGTGRGPFVVSKGRRVLVAVRNYRPRRK